MTASPLLCVRAEDLSVTYQLDSARLGDRPLTERYFADLRGCFADEAAFAQGTSA